MKEDLITYKTAVLAKEKGFDWHTLYFREDNKIYSHVGYDNFNAPEWGSNKYSAPTQALLQKWLREVHNIDVWAQPYVNTTKQNELIIPDETYSFYVFKDGVFKRDQGNHLDFESALEAGLIEALKLIEIPETHSKNKQQG